MTAILADVFAMLERDYCRQSRDQLGKLKLSPKGKAAIAERPTKVFRRLRALTASIKQLIITCP